jgi:TP901 family phage tail tape measure protein
MASARETLELILAAKDQSKGAFNTFGRNLDTTRKKIDAVAGPIADLSKKFLLLSTAATAAGAAMLGLAIKQAAILEDAVADLSKVFKGTDDELKQLQQSAGDLSKKYGQSITSIIEGMSRFAGAGADVNEVMFLQAQAMNSAEAGNLAVAEASQFLLQVQSGLGLKFKEVGRIVDSVNAIENNFNVRQREMFVALTESSGAARLVGISLEELEAVLTPMIEVMGEGSRAGTAMRIILTRMFNDVGTGRNEFENLGVALVDSEGNFRNFLDILRDLVPIWGTLNDAQKQNILSTEIGVRGLQGFSFVINDFNKVLRAEEIATNSAGSAWEEVEKKLKTTISAWNKLKETVHDFQRTIGIEFIPETKGLLDAIRETIDAVDDWEKKNGVIAGSLKNFLIPIIDDVVGSLKVLADNSKEVFEGIDLEPITAAFKGLQKTIRNLSDIDLSTVEGWTELFQTISDAVAGAVEVLDGMIKVGAKVGKVIFGLIKVFNDLPPSIKTAFGVGGALAIAATVVSPFIASIMSIIGALGVTGAVGGGLGLTGALGGVALALTGPVGLTVALAVVATAMLIQKEDIEALGTAWNVYSNTVNKVAEAVKTFFTKDPLRDLENRFDEFFARQSTDAKRLNEYFDPLSEGIKRVSKDVEERLKAIEIQKRLALRPIQEQVTGGATRITDEFGNVRINLGRIGDTSTGVAERVKRVTDEFGNTLIELGRLGKVSDSVAEKAKRITDEFGNVHINLGLIGEDLKEISSFDKTKKLYGFDSILGTDGTSAILEEAIRKRQIEIVPKFDLSQLQSQIDTTIKLDLGKPRKLEVVVSIAPQADSRIGEVVLDLIKIAAKGEGLEILTVS